MTTAPAVLVQANVFELEGYNTQNLVLEHQPHRCGRAHLCEPRCLPRVQGRSDSNERTQLGQLLTVPLSGNSPTIGPVESLTLVIPAVTVPPDTRQSSIQTIAVFSLRSVPGKLPNQSPDYMPMCLAGTARQNRFLNDG